MHPNVKKNWYTNQAHEDPMHEFIQDKKRAEKESRWDIVFDLVYTHWWSLSILLQNEAVQNCGHSAWCDAKCTYI